MRSITLIDMMKMYCVLAGVPLGEDSQARAGRQFTMMQAANWCVKWEFLEQVVDIADPWAKKWRLTSLGEAVLWHDIVYGVMDLCDRRHFLLTPNTINYLAILAEEMLGPENSLCLRGLNGDSFKLPIGLEPQSKTVNDLLETGLLGETWVGWLPGHRTEVVIPGLLLWASVIFQKRNLPF